jgi:hypothetical protein
MSDVATPHMVAFVYHSPRSKLIISYFEDVVKPAFETLRQKVSALENGSGDCEHLAIHDLEKVEYQTRLAFLLAIQSIWERQFRDLLIETAKLVVPQDIAAMSDIREKQWPYLSKKFSEYTGKKLDTCPSWPMLERLNYLGNYCRHGSGPAERWLRQEMPDLWPKSQVPPLPGSNSTSQPIEVKSKFPVISFRAFEESVEAIAAFWPHFDKGFFYEGKP